MRADPRPTKSLAIILSAVALAAISARSLAEVPPEAQPAFNKGVLAAQQQEWDIALQSFQDARKAAPTAPEIYYNLGLTESKIPGRELRAIAWLAAYLAADPAARNASAVKSAILGLLVKNEGNNARFIEVARQSAEQVSGGDYDKDIEKEAAIVGILTLYLDQGDEAKGASWASESHLNAGDITLAKKDAARYMSNDAGKMTGASASDWVKELDLAGNSDPADHGLSSSIFVDFSAHVASKTNTNPAVLSVLHMSAMYVSAMGLEKVAVALLAERRLVTEMLTRQFGPGFVP